MEHHRFVEMLRNNVSLFVPIAMDHVRQNRHMHEFRVDCVIGCQCEPITIQRDELSAWLTAYCAIVEEQWSGSWSIARVIDTLVIGAQVFRNLPLGHSSGALLTAPIELADALLVGFINDLCTRRCIDSAVYTSDLQPPVRANR